MYRMPAIDPDPAGGQWSGFSGPWRGGLFTALEGSNRTPCIVRWPGRVPVGRVSNEIVHEVDFFTTLVTAAGSANLLTLSEADESFLRMGQRNLPGPTYESGTARAAYRSGRVTVDRDCA